MLSGLFKRSCAADDFGNFVGDLSLTCFVVREVEVGDSFRSVVGCSGHGSHTASKFGSSGLEHGVVNLDLYVFRKESGENCVSVRHENVWRFFPFLFRSVAGFLICLRSFDGKNLLDPGKTPHENIQFLLVLTCILKAVDIHADLLRESAADVGNDHRLGGNEAPPAVISVFLGEQLEDVLDQLISTGMATHSKKGSKLHTGVKTLPDFMKDATDRNRTSPFAFTGNKFEFRMVGSRDSISECNVVLNTIAAQAFKEACDRLEAAPDFDLAVHDLIKEYATEHQRIVFNGNGYAPEWEEEAKRRGLPILPSMVDAIPALTTDKAVELFETFHVFTKAELESRAEIQYEIYAKAINIEAKTMLDIVTKQIIPAVIKYTTVLAQSVNAVRAAAAVDVSVQLGLLTKCSERLAKTNQAMEALAEVVSHIGEYPEGRERAVYCREKVVTAMEELRRPVDELEMLVDKEMWPMPSYGDLIFEV